MFIWIFTGRPALGLIISVQMKYKCSYQTQIVTEKRIKSGEKLEMSRKNMPRKAPQTFDNKTSQKTYHCI